MKTSNLSKLTSLLVTFFVLVICCVSTVFGKTVVVVGGGLAGLTAAYELKESISKDPDLKTQDLMVEVYEAKDRPGGRVFSVLLNGKSIELGGENLNDGGDAKAIRNLIHKFGLKVNSEKRISGTNSFYDQATSKYYNVNQDLLPYFPSISEQEIKTIFSKGEKRSKNLKEVIDYFFEKISKNKNSEQKQKLEILKLNLYEYMRSYEGGDVQHLSVRYAHGSVLKMLSYMGKKRKSLQTHIPYTYTVDSIEGGNSKLVLALAHSIGSDLHLNAPLRKIRKKSLNSYELVLGEGKTSQVVEADWVILAIPCKAYSNINFGEDVIPKERIKKISSVGYGTHAKIFVPYSPDPQLKVNDDFRTEGLSVWRNANKDRITFWLTSGIGLMRSPEDFAKAFDLGILAYGTAQPPLKKTPVQIPNQILGSYHTAVGLSWANDPYILGSYSYFTPELSSELEQQVKVDGENVLHLFTPIDGKIFFAGEHTTTDEDIRGTMEAAVQSGLRAARMILRRLR